MKTTQPAEAMTAKDHLRIKELLETISTLRSALDECLDFVQQEHDYDNPSGTTARLMSEIDEAIWQADEVTK
jgi:hypothetical protein